MLPLYTETEFLKAKSRDLLPLECDICKIPFFIQKNEIQKSIKRKADGNKRRNELKYCSHKCSHLAKETGDYYNCKNCNNSVYRTVF